MNYKLKIFPFLFLALALAGLFGCSPSEDDVLPLHTGGQNVLNSDTYSVYKNQTVRLPVLANDTVLSDGVLLFAAPGHGNIASDTNGFYYQPAANYLGADQFYYKYCTTTACDSALVTVNVMEAGNCQIIANPDVASTFAGQPVLVPVLANDVTCGPVTISNVSFAKHGNVTVLANNEFRYNPNPGFTGRDSLTYEFKTPDGRRANSRLYLTVLTNCTIKATSDAVNTVMNDSLTIMPLQNDSICQGPLQLSITGLPAQGTVHLLPNNRLIYQPAHNYVGPDQLEYQICRNGQCSRAIVYITVRPATINCVTGFTARNDSIPLPPGTPATNFNFNVLANDTYCQNQLISLSIIQLPSYGTAMPVMNNGIIMVNYVKTTPPGPAYTDSFRYEIRMNVNGQIQSRAATVRVIFR